MQQASAQSGLVDDAGSGFFAYLDALPPAIAILVLVMAIVIVALGYAVRFQTRALADANLRARDAAHELSEERAEQIRYAREIGERQREAIEIERRTNADRVRTLETIVNALEKAPRNARVD